MVATVSESDPDEPGRGSSVRPAANTSAPASASSMATPLPMPRLAPMTTATRPSSDLIGVSSLVSPLLFPRRRSQVSAEPVEGAAPRVLRRRLVVDRGAPVAVEPVIGVVAQDLVGHRVRAVELGTQLLDVFDRDALV